LIGAVFKLGQPENKAETEVVRVLILNWNQIVQFLKQLALLQQATP